MLGAFVGTFASCKLHSVETKDIKHLDIRFKPLSREDFTLVGNLKAEATITGKLKRLTNDRIYIKLDKQFEENYKQGKVTNYEKTEVLYFTPGKGEVITGDLYENSLFNLVYAPSNNVGKLSGWLGRFKKFSKPVSDPGMDFAYYALIAKYPDVDFFINVRFDRKTAKQGKFYAETVTVKADGIKLRTD